MRIKLTVSYDGTSFCGWQIQPDKPSVQQTVMEGIKALTGEDVSVTGSGRTDTGVHAEGQVCHFDTNTTIPPEKFYKALNTVLPSQVKAVKSELVGEDFSAVKSAKRKTYVYSLFVSDVELPLKERFAVRVEKGINVRLMKKAGKALKGEHDFKAFCSSGSEVLTTTRKIYKLKIKQKKQDIFITVEGNGFLYNMVRIIAGTLVKVGYKKLDVNVISKMLTTGDRTLGGTTLPAKGLCLKKVDYK